MFDLSRSSGLRVDLLDAGAVRAAVREAAPDVVHHLAARAHVGESWRMPEAYVRDNTAMTFHVLDAVREEAPEATVVVAASSELYGPPAAAAGRRDGAAAPAEPVRGLEGGRRPARRVLRRRARPARRARPRLQPRRPGQEPIYAIASFARQVAAGIVAGQEPVRVVTGNPDARRDYTDVRDVVRAYRALAESAEPGAYNVCSGRPASAAELLAALGRVAGVEIEHVVDPALRRANEVMEVRGSYDRLHAATGWEPADPARPDARRHRRVVG